MPDMPDLSAAPCPDGEQSFALTAPAPVHAHGCPAVFFSVLGHVTVLLGLLWLGLGQHRAPDVTVYQIALVGNAVAASAGAQAQEAQKQGEAPAPLPLTKAVAPKPVAPPEPPKPALSTVPQRTQAPRPAPQRVKETLAQHSAQTTPVPQTKTTSASGTQAGQAGQQAQGAQVGQQGQSTESAVYTVQQVDRPPAVLRRATPIYPPEAKKKALQGRVVVRLVVDVSGQATQCTVHSANPEGYFEAAALEAVGRMRFSPGEKAGRAVSTLVLLPFDFRLRK